VLQPAPRRLAPGAAAGRPPSPGPHQHLPQPVPDDLPAGRRPVPGSPQRPGLLALRGRRQAGAGGEAAAGRGAVRGGRRGRGPGLPQHLVPSVAAPEQAAGRHLLAVLVLRPAAEPVPHRRPVGPAAEHGRTDPPEPQLPQHPADFPAVQHHHRRGVPALRGAARGRGGPRGAGGEPAGRGQGGPRPGAAVDRTGRPTAAQPDRHPDAAGARGRVAPADRDGRRGRQLRQVAAGRASALDYPRT
jgi:hypothetical protein